MTETRSPELAGLKAPERHLVEVAEAHGRSRTRSLVWGLAAVAGWVRRVWARELLQRQDSEALLVRGAVETLDDLVAALVRAGVAVRELAPVVSPLEAAFLALTGDDR